jgi:hypothetical protein
MTEAAGLTLAGCQGALSDHAAVVVETSERPTAQRGTAQSLARLGSSTERASTMIGIVILLLIGAGFVLWDRRSPMSTSPDMRLVWVGVALAAIGAVSSVILWWLVVPVIVLLVGASLIVAGRHRITA